MPRKHKSNKSKFNGGGRWSSRRKSEVVMRLLRGEDLDAVSREVGVTAARLAEWRDQFLEAGQAGLKSRPTDVRDERIKRLQAKVGELTMDKEALVELLKVAGHPFDPRRSRS